MHRLAAMRRVTQTRWPALLLCYVVGALMAVAFAPYNCWPVIFFCLPVFFLMLEGATSTRRALWRGFAFGYGYFMAGTWWIANSLLVDSGKFGWMFPLSVLGLSAVLALYFMLFGALMQRLRRAGEGTAVRGVNILRFAVLWVAVEYLRSVGTFGFPWNLAGYIALASVNVAQLGSVMGTFGVSLLVVLVALAPLLAVNAPTRARRIGGITLPLLLIALAYGYGAARIPVGQLTTQTTLRVVQPNIAQAIKGTQEGDFESMRVLGQLSAGITVNPAQRPDITIWPETAYFDVLRGNRTGFGWAYSRWLLTGALAVEGARPDIQLYNSVAAIDQNGTVQSRYDKHQLVPFGEFMPLRDELPLKKVTPGDIDFTRGSGVQTVALEGIPPYSPLVCYEAVFPWLAVDRAHRPQWLLNVTNDGWYGDSAGPYQHFAMTRMRAIEQGLPLVRAANNGISAVVDPYGRVLAYLPLNRAAAIDSPLPAALPPTFYANFGEKLTIGLLVFLWLMTLFGCKKPRN